MFPIFILGMVIGSIITICYIEYKKDTPSQIKIESLEDTIEDLKEDIQVLESANAELRSKLEAKKRIKK